jgi:hypothetical protein
MKKKEKRVWGCKYQPLGEFSSACVHKLHKRFIEKYFHGRPTRFSLPKKVPFSTFITFPVDRSVVFIIYIYTHYIKCYVKPTAKIITESFVLFLS